MTRQEAFSVLLVAVILQWVVVATGQPMFDILFDHLPELLP